MFVNRISYTPPVTPVFTIGSRYWYYLSAKWVVDVDIFEWLHANMYDRSRKGAHVFGGTGFMPLMKASYKKGELFEIHTAPQPFI
jgi:hypothetical protein